MLEVFYWDSTPVCILIKPSAQHAVGILNVVWSIYTTHPAESLDTKMPECLYIKLQVENIARLAAVKMVNKKEK